MLCAYVSPRASRSPSVCSFRYGMYRLAWFSINFISFRREKKWLVFCCRVCVRCVPAKYMYILNTLCFWHIYPSRYHSFHSLSTQSNVNRLFLVISAISPLHNHHILIFVWNAWSAILQNLIRLHWMNYNWDRMQTWWKKNHSLFLMHNGQMSPPWMYIKIIKERKHSTSTIFFINDLWRIIR